MLHIRPKVNVATTHHISHSARRTQTVIDRLLNILVDLIIIKPVVVVVVNILLKLMPVTKKSKTISSYNILLDLD